MAEVQLVILFTSVALVVIGLYSAIFIDNIIKKIIGISFIEEGVNLFIVAIGYKAGGIVPILLPGMDTSWFACTDSNAWNGHFMVCFKRCLSVTFRSGTYQYCNRCKYLGGNACFSNGFIQKIWHIIHKSNVS